MTCPKSGNNVCTVSPSGGDDDRCVQDGLKCK